VKIIAGLVEIGSDLRGSVLARLAGLEPATGCLEGSCSIRLSYRRLGAHCARCGSRSGHALSWRWLRSTTVLPIVMSHAPLQNRPIILAAVRRELT
jgi:hypothetical protein